MTTFKLSYGRNDWTRTSGPMIPNHVRYQTALHPDKSQLILDLASNGRSLLMTTYSFAINQKNEYLCPGKDWPSIWGSNPSESLE